MEIKYFFSLKFYFFLKKKKKKKKKKEKEQNKTKKRIQKVMDKLNLENQFWD